MGKFWVLKLAASLLVMPITTDLPSKANDGIDMSWKPQEYVGSWYYVAGLPPCSFSGSSEFTNSVTQYFIQPDGTSIQKYIFRSTTCTTVEIIKNTTERAGFFENKDNIGNPISGPNVVLSTDYKTFAITWGCTRYISNKCLDPYLYVKTRKREPKPLTWKIIDSILQHYYDIGLANMLREVHDENACLTFDDEPRYSQKRHEALLHRLKKMY